MTYIPGGGSGSIAQSSDVALNNLTDNQVLVYDSAVEKWQNATTPTPTKADVGLGEVDNTSDADKPVSSLQQSALDAKVNIASSVEVVLHGTDANMTRPTGPASVMWIGSVAPTNALDDRDTWLDTSS